MEAIIFDKDGVLIDSMETCLTAFNTMLEHYGKRPIGKEEYRKRFWGIKASENIKNIFKGARKDRLEEIADYYRERRRELEHKTKLYPSVIPLLNSLKGKYKLAVVTNTERDVAKEILARFGIIKYFEVIVGGDDAKPKPAPDPALKACDLLGVEPGDAMYIGDTDADIGTAKSAGCVLVVVTNSKTRKELAGVEAIIIDDLREVPNLL